MVKNLNEESCKYCAGYAQIQTDYGTVRRCNRHKILLEEKYTEKARPDWCRKGVDDGKAD